MSANSADIILAICPPWGVVNPPLGPAYLASNLREKGTRAEIRDINVRLYHAASQHERDLWLIKNDNNWRRIDKVEELFLHWHSSITAMVQAITSSPIQMIGFTIVDPNEIFSAKFIQLIKQHCPEKIIIAGGPACEAPGQREFLNTISKQSIDYFIVGEGEHALPMFVQKLKSGGTTAEIPQVIDAKKVQTTTPAYPSVDLNTIVFPTFDEFDLHDYSGESIAVMWSRGCIGKCSYCKEKAIWGGYRSRSVENILQELQYCVAKYRICNFVVYDSAINGNPKKLEKICDAIICAGLKITWSGEAIALNSMTPALLEKMRKAGCHTLVYGIESGSDRVLKLMGKLSTRKSAGEVIRHTHEQGIKVAVNILVGFPGESEDDFQMTADLLQTHARWIDRVDSVSTLQIVTDTPLWEQIDNFNITLPESEPHDKWFLNDLSNTYEIRQQRLERILTIAGKKGFEIGRTFLNEHNKHHRPGSGKKWSFRQLLEKFNMGRSTV